MIDTAIHVESPETAAREMSDEVLITLFQGGDQSTFRTIVERYQERIRNLVFAILHDREAVDDLAQDIFIKTWHGLGDFQFNASFYTWLYRIAVNTCRDEIRRRKIRRFFSLHSDEDAEANNMLSRIAVYQEDNELQQVIEKELKKLPEKYRVPIILKDIEGMSYEEIADIMGCELGTVKSRLSRARNALRQSLQPYMEDRV